jgi:hypothetical protein
MQKTAKAKKEDSEVHIAIMEPENLRRYVLESAKDSIQFMQRQERLEEVRQQKRVLFEEMRGLLKEMVSLNNRLDKAMPRPRIDKPAIKREFAREAEFIREYEMGTGPIARSRLDVLEEELEEIEKRIGKLK